MAWLNDSAIFYFTKDMGNFWALTPFRLVFVRNPCYISDIQCQKLDPVGIPNLSDGK